MVINITEKDKNFSYLQKSQSHRNHSRLAAAEEGLAGES
jgi:hypothetical protein